MKLSTARDLAKDLVHQLQPYCTKIEIAGSIRRQCAEVKDIEIVCIPKREPITDLFGEILGYTPVNGFVKVIMALEKVKGDPDGKYTQRILPGGAVADIFMASDDNWGYIYAIRTGSAGFSKKVLAGGWVRAGYTGMEGHLTYKGRIIPVKEEEDLFRLIGVPFVHPIDRS